MGTGIEAIHMAIGHDLMGNHVRGEPNHLLNHARTRWETFKSRAPGGCDTERHDAVEGPFTKCICLVAQAIVCGCVLIVRLGTRGAHIPSITQAQRLNHEFDVPRVGLIGQTLRGDTHDTVQDFHF